MPKRKPNAAPSPRPEPSREQPRREVAKKNYSADELGMTAEKKRWNYAVFDTSTEDRSHAKLIKEIGATRAELATLVRTPGASARVYNSVIPNAMSFGEDGVKSGHYDEAGNEYFNGVGTLYWVAVTEQAASGPRAGETYFTLVECVNNFLDANHSRMDSKKLVVYYLNGPMIEAYGIDKQGLIPRGLLGPDIWLRFPAYMGFLPATCFTGPARAFKAPALALAPSQRNRHVGGGAAPDRDGAYIGGGIETTLDDLTIEALIEWDEPIGQNPRFLLSRGRIEDAHHFVQLVPEPYNFFREYDDAPIVKLKMSYNSTGVIIFDANHTAQAAQKWHTVATLDHAVAKAEAALPRERRTAFAVMGAIVKDESKLVKVPDASYQPALAADPRLLLLLDRLRMPVFPTSWLKAKDGTLRQRRPATADLMLGAIRDVLFLESQLDEQVTAKKMRQGFEAAATLGLQNTFLALDVDVELIDMASMWFFDKLEIDGTDLIWDFTDVDDDEYHCILDRLFGGRGVKVLGPRGRVYYKVAMASRQRGCGVVTISMLTHKMSVKVATARFNVNCLYEAGAEITPALQDGLSYDDHRFDLVRYAWVKGSVGIDPEGMDTKFEEPSPLAKYFGFNGTEM